MNSPQTILYEVLDKTKSNKDVITMFEALNHLNFLPELTYIVLDALIALLISQTQLSVAISHMFHF